MFHNPSSRDLSLDSIEPQRQALGGPAGFHELIKRDWMGSITSFFKKTFSMRASGWQNHVFPDTDCVTGEF